MMVIIVYFFESDAYTIHTTHGFSSTRLASTFFSTKNDPYIEIEDVDIVFNAYDWNWTADPAEVEDNTALIQTFATHEIGHLLGIHHNSISGSIMNDGALSTDETNYNLDSTDKFAAAFQRGGRIIDDITLFYANDAYFEWDVTIDSGKTLDISIYSNDKTVYCADGVDINVNGTLDISYSDTIFRKKSGASSWNGIKINDGGVISNGGNKIIIRDCSDAGVFVNDCSPNITNIEFIDASEENGGITVDGSYSNPTINYVTIGSTYYGLEMNTDANAVVDSCDVLDTNDEHSIYMHSGSGIDLDGKNDINPKSGKYAIYNATLSAIDAENNYWGEIPSDGLFYFSENVDYTPYSASALSHGAYKPAVLNVHETPEDIDDYAYELESAGEYESALKLYRELLIQSDNLYYKKKIIKSIMRVHERYDQDYTEIHELIQRELPGATSWYRATLDCMWCKLFSKEGAYEEAIAAYLERVDDYKGTPIEVEMLCRIAIIYGDYLNDKVKAKEYADRAAAINPGQSTLRPAYDAVNIDYHPAAYDDKYKNIAELDLFKESSQSLDEQLPVESEEIAEFVSVTPNPANPMTTITYAIANPSRVKLDIYNISGQKVSTLVDSPMIAGTHAATFDGSNLASGVYFYRLESKGFRKSGKMLLVK